MTRTRSLTLLVLLSLGWACDDDVKPAASPPAETTAEALPTSGEPETTSPEQATRDEDTDAEDCDPSDLRHFECAGASFDWAQLFIVPQPILTPDVPLLSSVLEEGLHDWLLAEDISGSQVLPGAYEAIFAFDNLEGDAEIGLSLLRDDELAVKSETRRFASQNAAWRWPLQLIVDAEVTLEVHVNDQVFRRETVTVLPPEEEPNSSPEAVDTP